MFTLCGPTEMWSCRLQARQMNCCCRVAATATSRNRLLRCEIIPISPSLRSGEIWHYSRGMKISQGLFGIGGRTSDVISSSPFSWWLKIEHTICHHQQCQTQSSFRSDRSYQLNHWHQASSPVTSPPSIGPSLASACWCKIQTQEKFCPDGIQVSLDRRL